MVGVEENVLSLTVFLCWQCTACIEKNQERQEKMQKVSIFVYLLHMARSYYSEYPMSFA
jgi:hypothetical protein